MKRRMIFRDRVDAGRRLAFALRRHRDETPIVLGLPRGGVPVAAEVARALAAPLDVWVVRKIGAPGHEELGLGAVCEGGQTYLNEDIMAELGLVDDDVAGIVTRKTAEVEQRVRSFRRGRPPPELEGRTVIVVDDGIATGGTVRAALRAIRRCRPKRLILAIPVASASTLESLRPEVDDVVCLDADPDLLAIGAYYQDFHQTTDDEVVALLEQARGGDAAARPEVAGYAIDVDVDGALLEGTLAIPAGAVGLVLFAHGSGSSRHSPRNRFVAEALQGAGLGTMLFDLLTAAEEAEDEVTGRLRFDVELLAARVLGAAESTRAQPETKDLSLGLFGASTGAAAALIAAARRPDLASAVVSRGGRPDLAGPYLGQVVAPTLLIVGSRDTEVLALNREAAEQIGGPHEIAVVAGATHLFEEPGALAEVARLAGAWFARHLAARVGRAAHAAHAIRATG
jgi:putative phosphoribosyl transferase